MSDSSAAVGVLNLAIAGCSGYGLYKIVPGTRPYAFGACVLGLLHGLHGLYCAFIAEGGDSGMKETCDSVMEIVPLPLVNAELYFMSDSNTLAMGHGLFLVPLAIDIILRFVKGEEPSEEGPTANLRLMSILGNCTALLYLAVNENSYWYGGLCFAAYMVKVGAGLIEAQSEGTGGLISLLSHTGFFYVTSETIGSEVK